MLNKYCTYIHDSKIIIETHEPKDMCVVLLILYIILIPMPPLAWIIGPLERFMQIQLRLAVKVRVYAETVSDTKDPYWI